VTLPDPDTLLVFIAASLALYIAPGPDMIYVISRSLGLGQRAGLLSCIGIFAGLLTHMAGAVLGLSALLLVWPLAYAVVQWVGVAYLVYLGLRTLSGRGEVQIGDATHGNESTWRLIRQGYLVNLLNPKVALFFLAFLPQFADPVRGPVASQLLALGLLFNLGGIAWMASLALLAGGLGDWLARRRHIWVWQRWLTGLALIGLAAQLAFGARR
jgi:threonine/homoserine/homoserine lactone efflux protein